MSNYRLWPIAALVIAVLFFLWGDDQPTPVNSTHQENQPVVSTPTIPQPEGRNAPEWGANRGHPPSVDPYGNYSTGYNTRPFSSPDDFRFRQSIDTTANGNQYESSYPPIQRQGSSLSNQDPSYQDFQGYGRLQRPGSNYHFRPLDQKRQEKRWHGNYGQMRANPVQPTSPNPYDRYPVPAYTPQSPSEPNPLWANSWPDR